LHRDPPRFRPHPVGEDLSVRRAHGCAFAGEELAVCGKNAILCGLPVSPYSFFQNIPRRGGKNGLERSGNEDCR
jgi:hypothetical protein